MTSTSAPSSAPNSTPTSAPAPTARRELRRSRSDAMLGGVSGGLADHTGIDPVLWRAAFVGLAFAGGAGVVLYAVLWVLTPPAPLAPGQQPRPVDRLVDRLAGRRDDVA